MLAGVEAVGRAHRAGPGLCGRPLRLALVAEEPLEPSPVLVAMGVDGDRSLRLSVGWSTTDVEDRHPALTVFPEVVSGLRQVPDLDAFLNTSIITLSTFHNFDHF